jgi:hypothetical protein
MEWHSEELTRKEAKLRRASQRILACHQVKNSLNDDELAHDQNKNKKLSLVFKK